MNNKKYPIKKEYKEYYDFLEGLRRTGQCNMWGATMYLEPIFKLDHKEASEILSSWIQNYDTLAEQNGWRK